MAHKLYMCYNCMGTNGVPGKPFEVERGDVACPECGLTQKESQSHIVKREVIHFDPPHPKIKGKGTNKRACDGRAIQGGMATGAPSSVTCPNCKTKPAYINAAEESGDPEVPSEQDYSIQSMETSNNLEVV